MNPSEKRFIEDFARLVIDSFGPRVAYEMIKAFLDADGTVRMSKNVIRECERIIDKLEE